MVPLVVQFSRLIDGCDVVMRCKPRPLCLLLDALAFAQLYGGIPVAIVVFCLEMVTETFGFGVTLMFFLFVWC